MNTTDIVIPPNAPPCWEYNPNYHPYTMNCICSQCAAKTRELITQYWQSPPITQDFARKQIEKTIPHRVEF